MSKGKRILLVTTALLLAANGGQAGFWKSRKTQAAPKSPAAAAMTLQAIEVESGRIVLRTSDTPAYTSYSPSSEMFVVDLSGAVKAPGLAAPNGLPPAIVAVSADEVTEMGTRLTRITFKLSEPLTPQASAEDRSVVVSLPGAEAISSAVAEVPVIAPEVAPDPSTTAEPPPAPVVEMSIPDQSITIEPIPSQPAKSLRSVATKSEGDSLEVLIHGDGSLRHKSFLLDNPTRLVIDLEGVRNRYTRGKLAVGGALVQGVRVSQFKSAPAPVTRVVVDLAGKTDYAVTPSGESLRVSFGSTALARKSNPPVAPAARLEVVEQKHEPVVPVSQPASSVAEIPTVVENSTWKMPPATRQVINAPMDQAPPDTRRAPPMVSSRPAENVFDEAAAVAQQPLGPGGRTLSGTGRVFTGDPISLNLKDADIKDVLRTFSQLTGLNIAVDPGVSGTVTVDFVDVPWDQALDLILRQNGLTFTLEGNVMRIGTIERIAAETRAARDLAEQERLNVPLTTLSFKLSYARAPEVQTLLREIASPRAKIIMDARTNQLIVSEIPQYLQVMRNLIDTVDVPTRQVQIEARVVETTKQFSLQYGFSWGFGGVLDPALGTGTGLIFPNRIAYTAGPYSFTGGAPPIFGVQLFDVLGTFDIDLTLHAAELETLARVISAPKVTTQDNIAAEIQSGVQIPYQTRINFTTTITYIDATLRLSVTPQITEAGTIIMDIAVQKTTPTGPIEGAAGTPLNTRQARTRVMVRDGGTAVIGGIYQASENNNQSRVPVLHQIPILGALFRSNNRQTTHDELLIFITPRIVRGS